MLKSAEQIAYETMEKVAISPGLAMSAILRHVRRLNGYSPADYAILKRFPRTLERAQASRLNVMNDLGDQQIWYDTARDAGAAKAVQKIQSRAQNRAYKTPYVQRGFADVLDHSNHLNSKKGLRRFVKAVNREADIRGVEEFHLLPRDVREASGYRQYKAFPIN